MAGQLVGAACASSLSDRFGRKIVHLSCNLLTLILGIGVAFASNYTVLAVGKFILGVLQQVLLHVLLRVTFNWYLKLDLQGTFIYCFISQGIVMSGVVFTLELFPEQTRYTSEVLGSFIWTTGLVIMSCIAFLLRHYSWRHLQIVLSCFSLLSVVQYWWVERWKWLL